MRPTERTGPDLARSLVARAFFVLQRLSPTCGVSYNKAHTPGIPVYENPPRPRFFRITTFESDMRRVLQQSAHTGNPSLRKPSACILSCRRLSRWRVWGGPANLEDLS